MQQEPSLKPYLTSLYRKIFSCRLVSAIPDGILYPRALQLHEGFLPLLTSYSREDEEAKGLRSVNERIESSKKPQFYYSAVEMLCRYPHLVLVGEPGSGKSTFAQHTCLCLTGELLGESLYNLESLQAAVSRNSLDAVEIPQTWDLDAVLPILIQLDRTEIVISENPDGDSLLDLGVNQDHFAAVKQVIQSAGALLIVDGLDHLSDREWEYLLEIIFKCKNDYPLLRIIVTGQRNIYHRRKRLPGFPELTLSPFMSPQLAKLARKWMAAANYSSRMENIINEYSIAGTSAPVSGNPLLCGMLLSLNLCGVSGDYTNEYQIFSAYLKFTWQFTGFPYEELIHSIPPLVQRHPDLRLEHRESNSREVVHLEQLIASLAKNNPKENDSLRRQILQSPLFQTDGTENNLVLHQKIHQFLAAEALLYSDFPSNLIRCLKANPLGWWQPALFACSAMQKIDPQAVQVLLDTLLGTDAAESSNSEYPESHWQALLAAWIFHPLFVEGSPFAGKDFVQEKILNGMLGIVQNGWLPPVDRDFAGQVLSLLGDPRDFDELIRIPAGPFIMGDDHTKNAIPEHILDLPEYKIGKFPVTNRQYLEYIQHTHRSWLSLDTLGMDRMNAPATMMTWHEARKYCQWLTQTWQMEGTISMQEEVRLPTEAEWEKAARGPLISSDSHPGSPSYPWGNEWMDGLSNTQELGLNDVCTVGMFPGGASYYGCLDMCGQVWEWISTLWGPNMQKPDYTYPYDSGDGRESSEAAEDIRRVLRGGSFASSFDHAGCIYRGSLEPMGFWRGDGFRIVVAPKGK